MVTTKINKTETNEIKKFRIKSKYLFLISKYAVKTKLNIRSSYTKETWNSYGYKDSILEEVNSKQNETQTH